MPSEKIPKSFGKTLKNFVLGIAIFLLTMFVAMYGIKTVYTEPKYEDFCKNTLSQIDNRTLCINEGGKWVGYSDYDSKISVQTIGRCEAPIICNDEFEKENEKHSKNVFISAVPLAILLIALGAFVFRLNPVGVGIMFGGIGTLIYGAGGYWRYADNFLKFIISLIGLIVLIFLAYWFNKRFDRKK